MWTGEIFSLLLVTNLGLFRYTEMECVTIPTIKRRFKLPKSKIYTHRFRGNDRFTFNTKRPYVLWYASSRQVLIHPLLLLLNSYMKQSSVGQWDHPLISISSSLLHPAYKLASDEQCGIINHGTNQWSIQFILVWPIEWRVTELRWLWIYTRIRSSPRESRSGFGR